MKRISKRSTLSLLLALTLAAGLLVFMVSYFKEGSDWALKAANMHIYSKGNLNTGRLLDVNGEVLLESVDNQRIYNSNETTRTATLHIVGDNQGNIPSAIQRGYAAKLASFDYLNGVYTHSGEGNELVLTLDAEVCAEAYRALDGRKGTVGVYNYKTGEILCMVSSPSFDPMNVPDISSDKTGRYEGVYINRFMSADYVPGSIFKIVASAAAIENIDDLFEKQFYCDGFYEINGEKVKCSGYHYNLDFKRALAVSCNTVFGYISEQLGKDILTEYAEAAGLNKSIEFDGLKTSTGNFNLDYAAPLDVAWAGIGQYTDTINPCSFMMYAGAIGNGGLMTYPRLVSGLYTSGGHRLESYDKIETERVLDESTADILADLMKNNTVSVYGEGRFPGLDLCAKSGTAEVGGGKDPHATFVGFLRNPEYPLAFIVIIENGGDGSSISGSVANSVLQKCVESIDKRG